MDEYPIVVSQLEKNYMHLKAVRGIDFAVRKGEFSLISYTQYSLMFLMISYCSQVNVSVFSV